jgi:hypothetical protein
VGTGSHWNREAPPAGSSVNNGKAGIYIDIDNPAPASKLAFWEYLGLPF